MHVRVEQIPHGDHYDYLVGGRLHHVLQYCDACCPSKCLGPLEQDAVVDHGVVDVVDATQAQKDIQRLKVRYLLQMYSACDAQVYDCKGGQCGMMFSCV